MKIFCKELNKHFESKSEMLKELKARKEDIISIKRATVKYSDPAIICLNVKDNTTKEDDDGKDNSPKIGDYVFPVINTTNYLDSHGDVHINGLWDVSIRDQKNKLYYLINHNLEIGSVVGYPKDVEAYVKTLNWSDLGRSYPGTTQALIFKVLLTEKANKDALAILVDRQPIENSVRMQYISMTLCINDNDPEFKAEYENFYKYLPVIANKEDAMERGYFWAITEAKIFKEGSMVLAGSNDATPVLYEDDEKSKITFENEKKRSPLYDSLLTSTPGPQGCSHKNLIDFFN